MTNIQDREKLAYKDDEAKKENAGIIVDALRKRLDFTSVLDLGCGTMVYRDEFEKHADYLGVDGNPDAEPMVLHDLSTPLNIDKFDLVFCIEVAEHIKPEYESVFLNNVVRHANKWIVMTACPPKPGNKSEYRALAHFNEQPREYWIDRLESLGCKYRKNISMELQAEYREHPVKGWFKNNLMVFECVDL